MLHADTNYRSPRDILEHLNKLLTLDRLLQPQLTSEANYGDFLMPLPLA